MLDYTEKTTLRLLIKKEVQVLRRLIDRENNEDFIKSYKEEIEYFSELFDKLL